MIYSDFDIECEDNGDLVLEGGDLKTALASRTVAQALSFIVLTDYGEYIPRPLTGGNLGSFIGKLNTSSTRNRMRSNVQLGIDEQGAVQSSQVAISVNPIDVDQSLVLLRMPLVTVETDPDDNLESPLTLGFVFPYLSGEVEKLSLPDDQGS